MSTTARRRASVWSYRSLIWNFTQRDLKSRFKGTALGWAWSLVVPLATLFTYSLVFAVIFKAAPPPFGNGNPGFFPVWLFCGLIPWSFFLISINTAIPVLLANGPTLQKVYFPSYAPVLGSVAGILVQTLIECAILAVALLLFHNVGPTWLLFPFWLCLFVVFVAGVALSLSIMNVYYRDLAHLTNVVLQLLFFLTPIIYQAESVPESWYGIPLGDRAPQPHRRVRRDVPRPGVRPEGPLAGSLAGAGGLGFRGGRGGDVRLPPSRPRHRRGRRARRRSARSTSPSASGFTASEGRRSRSVSSEDAHRPGRSSGRYVTRRSRSSVV